MHVRASYVVTHQSPLEFHGAGTAAQRCGHRASAVYDLAKLPHVIGADQRRTRRHLDHTPYALYSCVHGRWRINRQCAAAFWVSFGGNITMKSVNGIVRR